MRQFPAERRESCDVAVDPVDIAPVGGRRAPSALFAAQAAEIAALRVEIEELR